MKYIFYECRNVLYEFIAVTRRKRQYYGHEKLKHALLYSESFPELKFLHAGGILVKPY